MKLPDVPEHGCPECDEHPRLVYEDSGGAGGPYEPGDRMDGKPNMHFYRCPMCNRKLVAAMGGKPTLSPANQKPNPRLKECSNCGPDAMRVGKRDKGGPVPDSGRKLGQPFNRVETELVWRCDRCGEEDSFHESDLYSVTPPFATS